MILLRGDLPAALLSHDKQLLVEICVLLVLIDPVHRVFYRLSLPLYHEKGFLSSMSRVPHAHYGVRQLLLDVGRNRFPLGLLYVRILLWRNSTFCVLRLRFCPFSLRSCTLLSCGSTSSSFFLCHVCILFGLKLHSKGHGWVHFLARVVFLV